MRPILAASVVLLSGFHLAIAADSGLLCSNYAAACSTALSSFGCTKSVAVACGGAGTPATLDNFNGTCTCLEPYFFDTPSGRLQEEIWDAAVKSSIGSLVQYVPGSSAQVDFSASVGNVCQTGLRWLGCPPGKALVNPTSTDAQACQCLCGSGFDISTRAVEGVVDHILSAYFQAPPPPQLCSQYPVACGNLMAAAGCPPASPVGGCTVAGDISTFGENCTCSGPPPTTWDNGGGRITELFIDSVLKPRAAASLLPLGAPPFNLSASYVAACASTLGALLCPAADASNPGTSAPGAPFACTCGGGGLDASVRVAEDLLDQAMGPFMEGVAAAAAAARAGPAPSEAPFPVAWVALVAGLGGALLLLLGVAAGMRCAGWRCVRPGPQQPSAVEVPSLSPLWK